MKRNTLWAVIFTVLIIGLAAWPIVGFAQEVVDTKPAIDWEGLIVKVVLAVLGILVTIFASKINTWLGKYFDAKWKRDGAIAISQLAWDALAKYATEHPDHEWPQIPQRLLAEFIERLQNLGMAAGESAAERALAGAVAKMSPKLTVEAAKVTRKK